MAVDVEINVVAIDNASGTLGGLGGALGNLGNIVTGIKSAFDLVGGAIDAAVGFISPFIDSASESEQAVARLEGVLKATGGAAGLSSQQLQDMADSLQNTTRFSDETILAGESLLLTFRNIGAETFERAVPAMADMAEIFGSVDSAAMQLGKALNDPVAGMGALARAGITFSDEQKEMIKNFMETGDVASAQNIILSEVEAQVQGLAETMGNTFAGKIDIFMNKLDSLKELIGGPIITVFGGWLGTLTDFIDSPAVQGIITFLDTFNSRLEGGLPAFSALGMTFVTNSGYFKDFGFALMGIQEAIDKSGWFTPEFWASVKEAVGSFFSDFSHWFESTTGIELSMSGIGEALVNAVKGIDWTGISQALAAGMSSIDWGWVGNQLATGLGYLAIAIGTIISEIDWGALLSSIGNALVDLIAGLFGFIDWEDMYNSALVGFRYVGNAIVDGLKTGLQEAWNNFYYLPKTLFDNFVTSIKILLGISSDSTVFKQIAHDIVGGLISGFNSAWSTLMTIARTALADFAALFGIDLGTVLGTGAGTLGGGTATHVGPGGTTSTTTGGTSGSVINNYYGPVYFGSAGEPGAYYDCPSPHPLVAASGNQLVTSGF